MESNITAGPTVLNIVTSIAHEMSELIVLLAGIVAGIVIDERILWAYFQIIGRLYDGTAHSNIQIAKDTPSVRTARQIAAVVPNWVWELLTWAIFTLGYVSKSMYSWSSTTIYLFHFVAVKRILPDQKLILDSGWYLLTIYRSWHSCQQDYRAYMSLGAGGTPQTWNGFKRITLLGWFGKIDTLSSPKSEDGGEAGFLGDLEQRLGKRPTVVGIAPQRQLDQRSPIQAQGCLRTYLDRLSDENSSRICTETSFLERHIPALRANHRCMAQPIFQTFGGEIAHVHAIDGSLHVMLHPSDIKKIIASGWGERHSIARNDSWWMWWFFATEERPPISVDLCFIYAPRSEYEVCVVADIVEAGVKYVTNLDNRESIGGVESLKGLIQME